MTKKNVPELVYRIGTITATDTCCKILGRICESRLKNAHIYELVVDQLGSEHKCETRR